MLPSADEGPGGVLAQRPCSPPESQPRRTLPGKTKELLVCILKTLVY